VTDIFHAAGGQIVEQGDGVTAVKKALRQMRADETGTAGD